MKTILFIFGTRPEALKLIPLVKEFQKYKSIFNTKICITSQHQEMLWQVLDFFEIKPDFNLELMKPNQTLFDITSIGLKKLESIFETVSPDLVIVQGDTTSTFIGALAAFYNKVSVAHVEAGLRSFDKYSPFPEEINRKMVSTIADFHFAPTQLSKKFLKQENYSENIYVVGNTVIDSLLLTIEKIKNDKIFEESILNQINQNKEIDFTKKIILITGHRRESFGEPFQNICNAILKISKEYKDVEIIYPVHLNPNVREPVFRILGNEKNIHLIAPQNYPEFVYLMSKSYIILTDSGGVQEEAPSLGKPVLVMRNVTERTEGIESGTAKLVGTDENSICLNIKNLLDNESSYEQMANAINPYGDGTSSQQIVGIIENFYNGNN